MLSTLVFGRKRNRGSQGPQADGDLFVSRVKQGSKSGREDLSVRVHADVMKRLRWIAGDYVQLRFGDDQATQIVLQRVEGAKQGGMRLCASTGKSSAHATVRFSADKGVLDEIFKDGMSFLASFYEAEGTAATFIRD